mgnify:CR=1 FL=1
MKWLQEYDNDLVEIIEETAFWHWKLEALIMRWARAVENRAPVRNYEDRQSQVELEFPRVFYSFSAYEDLSAEYWFCGYFEAIWLAYWKQELNDTDVVESLWSFLEDRGKMAYVMMYMEEKGLGPNELSNLQHIYNPSSFLSLIFQRHPQFHLYL